MTFKIIFRSVLVGLITSLFISSCESDEALAIYDNPNQSDTTGNNVQVDLFVSAEVDNIPVHYANGINKYTNWTISEEEGFCGVDTSRFLQSHSTAFIIPSKLEESIYVNILGCVKNDSASALNKIDSVLVVGPYSYYPKLTHNRSAMINYIDMDSVLWSTSFGGNTSSFARFDLSAIIDNNDDNFSAKIAFGKFEGYLYNGQGDSLKIKNGQFKGRIVQN
tara:strand:+ start:53488 stop:54150 length:663 start_codon:yes stop_codon:yes gene_type:complete